MPADLPIDRACVQAGATAYAAQCRAIFAGEDAASPAIKALRSRDYLTFASIYNGPGNAATYSDVIQRYVAAYNRIIG